MALPTMPAAVMLLQLGSLSNLMMTNTAVFLICSLPKKPNNYLGEREKKIKVICLLFFSMLFSMFFFLTLKRLEEEGTGRMGSLGKGWPSCQLQGRDHIFKAQPMSYIFPSPSPTSYFSCLFPEFIYYKVYISFHPLSPQHQGRDLCLAEMLMGDGFSTVLF